MAVNCIDDFERQLTTAAERVVDDEFDYADRILYAFWEAGVAGLSWVEVRDAARKLKDVKPKRSDD